MMAQSESPKCRLKEQGFLPGSCQVKVDTKKALACQATLKQQKGIGYRLITSVHLSRPENYLSIYQSGCNFSCRKCHSWHFSKVKQGSWYSPQDILKKAKEYEKTVTLWEPRENATAWHAHDTCRCCGSCVINRQRSVDCPGILSHESICLSPQGFGPARNTIAFTGGDLMCCPEFYGECGQHIKAETKLWLLIETNGYGLTPHNLDYLKFSGVDAFWLDIKAHDPEKHQWLTGCSNDRILRLPEEIMQRDFVLEVLSLYIPGVVEAKDLQKIAEGLKAVDSSIPFTILAFFPEHQMRHFRSPTVEEMVEAYETVRRIGLTQIRLGNLGVFVHTEREHDYLAAHVDVGAY